MFFATHGVATCRDTCDDRRHVNSNACARAMERGCLATLFDRSRVTKQARAWHLKSMPVAACKERTPLPPHVRLPPPAPVTAASRSGLTLRCAHLQPSVGRWRCAQALLLGTGPSSPPGRQRTTPGLQGGRASGDDVHGFLCWICRSLEPSVRHVPMTRAKHQNEEWIVDVGPGFAAVNRHTRREVRHG